MKLPEILFAKIQKDSGSEWINAQEEPADLVEMGEKVRVGRYELVEVLDATGVAQFDKPRRK